MKEFATYEAANELFRGAAFSGEDNNIFIAYTDPTKSTLVYGMFGAVGAVGAALLGGLSDGTNGGFDGLLINPTSRGLGLIPLNTKGVAMTINPEKMFADVSKFTFVGNENIESIILKNYNIFNSKVKKLKIKIRNSQTLHLMVNVKEKKIPYHEENFAAFMEKYKK